MAVARVSAISATFEEHMSTGALVLCGGQSRRMGRSKAWLPFGPEALLQRVVRLVGRSAGPIVVVAACDQELPTLPDEVRVVHDEVANRGPLQGLAAGLSALPGSVDVIYATATDGPFLAPAWISRLRALIADADMVVPHGGNGRRHPLAALYRRDTILPIVHFLLAANDLRLHALFDSARARMVPTDELRDVDPDLKTLHNLNTPEDYRAALIELGSSITGAELHILHQIARVQCPCCDYFTLERRGIRGVCPVCFWEDDGQDPDRPDARSGCNCGLTLCQGRENFRRLGACEPGALPHVVPAEGRRLYRSVPGWKR